mgnify:CR=1 FL=1
MHQHPTEQGFVGRCHIWIGASMKHKRAGRLCMLAGALCILVGAVLTGYNLYTDHAAEEQSEHVLAQLRTSCSLPAL